MRRNQVVSFLIAIVAACNGGGGGGGGPGGGAATTIEVTPATATVGIGGSAQYVVVARDGAGAPTTAPPVVWSSGSPDVGTIGPDGLAVGVHLGQTQIIAKAGSIASLPAVLNVVDHDVTACDGIADVRQWDVKFQLRYADDITTPKGVKLGAFYQATVGATLTPSEPTSGPTLAWSGPLVGAVTRHDGTPAASSCSLSEDFDDHVSDPTTVATIEGHGPPLPSAGVDGFRLEVTLATCTYRFFVAAAVHTKLTKTEHAVSTLPGPDEGTHETEGDVDLGIAQKGVASLGAWRASGIGDYARGIESIPAYPIGIPVPDDIDAFTPSGVFAQVVFFDPLAPAPRADKADIYFAIVPHF